MRSVRQALVSTLAVGLLAAPALAAEEATTPDLLPGVDLVTEEVAPGVYRVLSDGVRDLSRPIVGEGYEASFYQSNLAAGPDGSVWIFEPDRFYRLGDPRAHESDEGTPTFLGTQVEVGADGQVWAVDWSSVWSSGLLRSLEGASWEVRADGVTAFDVASDGTVWATTDKGLQHLGPDGWVAVGDPEVPLGGHEAVARFWVSPLVHEFFEQTYEAADADIEILNWSCSPGDGACSLAITLIEGTMSISGPASGDLPAAIVMVDMGDGGDYWILQYLEVPLAGEGLADTYPRTRTIDYLVHVEGGPMTIYTNDEGVPELGDFYEWGPGFLRAGPDGTVWLTPGGGPGIWGCDGLARFDGQTWTRYLKETCLYALDVAPDGTVWGLGGTWADAQPGPVELYAITPEAVASTE